MKIVRIVTGAVLAAAAAASAASAQQQMPTMNPMQSTEHMISVRLLPQNNSGETGTATLMPMGEKTQVTVALRGAPEDPQPLNIFSSACKDLESKPAYPLSPAVAGKSSSLVDVPLAKLSEGGYAIAALKSTAAAAPTVTCGDIPKA